MKVRIVRITFTEPLLGTIAGNKELAEDYIIGKHPEGFAADEQEALPDVDEEIEKASTFFARDKNGNPMMWDYQWKGYFKEACEALIHSELWTKEELKKYRLTPYLYKKTIDKQVFVCPRRIVLALAGKPFFVQRPLRGQTMKGERICLARSEAVPQETTLELEIEWLNDNLGDWIVRWLDYGIKGGTGQWRNGGFGRFTWEDITPERSGSSEVL
jgi:hypothetical protein